MKHLNIDDNQSAPVNSFLKQQTFLYHSTNHLHNWTHAFFQFSKMCTTLHAILYGYSLFGDVHFKRNLELHIHITWNMQ